MKTLQMKAFGRPTSCSVASSTSRRARGSDRPAATRPWAIFRDLHVRGFWQKHWLDALVHATQADRVGKVLFAW